MKRSALLLFIFLVICATFNLFGFETYAEAKTETITTDFSFPCGYDTTWNYDAETETVTISGTGDMYDYYGGAGVNGYDDEYVSNRETVKKVVIENGVTSIGSFAFCQFKSLETVVMADSVEFIYYAAFEECISLKKVTLSNNLSYIGEGAFGRTTSLETVSFPDGVETIDDLCFYESAIKGKIELPDSLKRIGYGAFEYCENLEEVVVPEGVSKISGYTFMNYAKVVVLNRNCVIDENAIFGSVSGYTGSTAQEYAKTYNKPFEPLVEHEHEYKSKVTKKATCTKKGIRTYTCECGDTYTKAIAKASHSYTSKVTEATTSKNGKVVKTCRNCGYNKSSTVYSIKSIVLSKTTYTYDGKAKAPSVVVKDSKGNKLVKGTDYTVKYASGRKAVGTYKVKVTFKGKYSGSKTLSFKVVLGQVKNIRTQRNGKGIDVIWDKVKGATGYIIYEYDSRSGKYVEKARTTSNMLSKKQYSGNLKVTMKVKAYYKSYTGKASVATKVTL